jgi:hypothetical protein
MCGRAVGESMSDFESRLRLLVGNKVDDIQADKANIWITFSSGAKVYSSYWRLIRHNGNLSSFDHMQKYGLPNPIDAVAEVSKALKGKILGGVASLRESGDLEFIFENKMLKLQVFNFSGYEVWEVEFSDGTGQLSNYYLAKL